MDISLNQKLNNIIQSIDINNKPNLFLHVCCGPCSTEVLNRLNKYFNIFIIFYNSNIDTKNEFDLRYEQLKKVIDINKYDVKILYSDYNHDEFLSFVKGFENEIEGGKRCEKCYRLRLSKSYEISIDYINKSGLQNNENYLCSTLSISPHKNAKLLEYIGEDICKNSDILKYLPNDFKKENGYLNSIILSKEYGLYRQEYCGCEFSK